MTLPRLSAIYRHPLKAIGREALDSVTLETGGWMPWDRVWAVTHERAKPLDGGWGHKMNFLRGVTDPGLMAVACQFDAATGQLTLDHPDAGQIMFTPDAAEDQDAFLEWVGRIWPASLPAPTGLYRAENAHLTDVPDPWIAINSTESLNDLANRAGQRLSPHRWRGNLWLDDLEPWAEFDLVGQTFEIGDLTFEVEQPITRCKATMANPETGQRDVDTLALLDSFGHQDFGVYARVVSGGALTVGDPVRLPS